MKEWIAAHRNEVYNNPDMEIDEPWLFTEYINTKSKELESSKKFNRTNDKQDFVFPDNMLEAYQDLLRKTW